MSQTAKMQAKLEALIAKLDTSSDLSAEKTIGELARAGREAVASLVAAAKDTTEPRIRKWSLEALGEIGDKRAAPVLIAALKDARMTVRLHAVRGLARMKHQPAVKAIADLLDDESGGIRVNALSALVEIGASAEAALPKIIKRLSDSQWYVRQNAAVACGKLGGTKAKKKLQELAENDPRKAVRDAATKALSLLD